MLPFLFVSFVSYLDWIHPEGSKQQEEDGVYPLTNNKISVYDSHVFPSFKVEEFE